MSSEASLLPSTRPYLIRALHEWCTENGFTPYLVIKVGSTVSVPAEQVRNGEIVLNVSFDATSGLRLGNDYIEFKARFGGVPRDLVIPVDHVIAIYARENAQGMAFPPPPSVSFPITPTKSAAEDFGGNIALGFEQSGLAEHGVDTGNSPSPAAKLKPYLKRIK